MKKLGRLLIIVTLISFSVYCQLEVPIEEPKNNIEELRIMNDFTVKPFTEFPAYYAQGNRVFGIPADTAGREDLTLIIPEIVVDGETKPQSHRFDEFFVKDGKVYFKMSKSFPVEEAEPEVITKYCSMNDGAVKYSTKAKYPAMPESVRIEGQAGDHSIINGDYDGKPISIARRNYDEPFEMIDGFMAIPGGLLIHTPTGRGSSRPAGLLFWPDGVRTMNHWKEVGRFWK